MSPTFPASHFPALFLRLLVCLLKVIKIQFGNTNGNFYELEGIS